MKRFFTLAIAALAAMTISAKTVLDKEWSSWGDGCTVDGKTITFSAAWKGAGYWISPTDASNDALLVLVFAEPTEGSTQFYVEAESDCSAKSATVAIPAGSRVAYLDLKNDAKLAGHLANLSQICVQSQNVDAGKEAKLVFQEVYLGSEADLEETKSQVEIQYETEGTNVEFDQYGNVLTSQFEALKLNDNDKVVFTYTTTGELTNDQGSIVGWGIGSIKSLKGNVKVTDINAAKLGDNDVVVLYKDLKAALADEANEYNQQGINWNMWAQGNSTNTRKSITVYRAKTTTNISTIATTKQLKSDAIYNLAGQQVSKSYKGVVIKNGKKMLQK